MKSDPRVVIGAKVLPANEIVEAVASFVAVEDVGNGVGGFVGELEKFGFSVGMEFRRAGVGLEK